MARTYSECRGCGYLNPVDSELCSNCGKAPLGESADTVKVPGEQHADSAPLTTSNPASTGAVDELLLEELRKLRRMQDRQGRSLLRWLKFQSLVLALTGLFVTIIILLAYVAITGPIG